MSAHKTWEPEVMRYYEPYADVTPPLVKSKRGNFVLYSDYLRCAQERDAAVRERDANSAMADAAIDDATRWEVEVVTFRAKLAAAASKLDGLTRVYAFSEWHEDHGDVLWWMAPICEPPSYVGTPLDSSWPWEDVNESALVWCKSMQPETATPTPPQEATNDDA